VVDVANPDLALRPGMTANVTFVYADRPDVLRVPNAALRFRPSADLQGPRGGAAGGAPGAGAPGAGAPGAGGARRAEAGEPSERRTVWVLRGEKPEPVRVRTGVSDGSMTEVLEGDLREGDAAVTDSSGGGEGKPSGMGGGRGGPPRIL
jgi:HlyD family secretion protein